MPLDRALIAILDSKEPVLKKIEQLQRLLKSRSDINLNATFNEAPRKGHTAFSWLVMNNQLELAQAILNFGADPKISPKDFDVKYTLQSLIFELQRLNESQTQKYDVVVKLLYSILDPNSIAAAPAFAPYKCTQLMADLVSENDSIVKSVVANFSDTLKPNIQDIEGKTILTLAVKMNRTEIVEFLLKHLAEKIDVNLQDKAGNTPLHYAFAYGNKAMITALLANGARTNIKNADGLTAAQMIATPKEKVLTMLDSVAINGNRDVQAIMNDPPHFRPGEDMMSDGPINSWEYLASILTATPSPDKKVAAEILALKSKYSGISMVDQIEKNKSDQKSLLELISTVKPVMHTKAPVFHTPLADSYKAGTRQDSMEKKYNLEAETTTESPKESAAALVRSSLYAEDLKIQVDDYGDEALIIKLANPNDIELYVNEYGAIIVDEESQIVSLPKEAAIAVLKADGLETAGDTPIWEALKDEIGVSRGSSFKL